MHKTDGSVQREQHKEHPGDFQGTTEGILQSQGVLPLPSGLKLAAELTQNIQGDRFRQALASPQAEDSYYRATGPSASIRSSTEARTNINLIDSFPRAAAQSGTGAERKERAGLDIQRITENENKY